MEIKKYCLLSGAIFCFLVSFSLVQASDKDEGLSKDTPHSYPLYSVKYERNELGDSDDQTRCQPRDFRDGCNQFDGQCKARKGSCGEFLSETFFSRMSWTQLKSHYSGNQGFDGFYKTNSMTVKYVVVEDKAGNTALKKRQMSLWWQADRARKLRKVAKSSDRNLEQDEGKRHLTKEEHKEFQVALREGKVIGLLTRTFYENSNSSSLYSFFTEIYLLGHPTWPENFQMQYIKNYSNIHPSRSLANYNSIEKVLKESETEKYNNTVLRNSNTPKFS